MDGGPAGDLYITVKLKPHPHFIRQNNNLLCEIEVDFVQAILGSTAEVPILDGQVELKVPPAICLTSAYVFVARACLTPVALGLVMCILG